VSRLPTPRPGRREKHNEAPSWFCAFSFVAASHRCAMPIARSAPAVASATEIARAKRSIFRSSHRDIAHSPAPGPHFSAARFGVRPLQTRAPLRAGLRIRGLTVQLQWQCVGLVRPFYDRLRAARWHIERVLLCSSSPLPPSPPAEEAAACQAPPGLEGSWLRMKRRASTCFSRRK